MPFSSENIEKNPSLSEALLSFAHHRHVEPGRIARLMRKSDSFREICADYEECCSKLLNLGQEAATAGKLVRDYAEMREQLERDLLRCLEEAAQGGSSGRRKTN